MCKYYLCSSIGAYGVAYSTDDSQALAGKILVHDVGIEPARRCVHPNLNLAF